MFYVANISGGLTPFDPAINSSSNAVEPTLSAPQIIPTPQVTAATTSAEVNSTVDAPTTQTLSTAASLTETEEAAVFEGHAITTGRDLAGIHDSLNVGRAGAIGAYRIQSSEVTEEAPPAESLARILPIPETTGVHDDSEKSPRRVNPIKNYRRQPRERTRVVTAADIMSSPVVTLQDDIPIEAAQRLFHDHKFRHIPILSPEGKLIGILSDRDCIGTTPQDTRVMIRDRMVTNILTAAPHAEIHLIAEVMVSHHIGCLPIVEETGHLAGILTRGDILRAIVNHAPIELWT